MPLMAVLFLNQILLKHLFVYPFQSGKNPDVSGRVRYFHVAKVKVYLFLFIYLII